MSHHVSHALCTFLELVTGNDFLLNYPYYIALTFKVNEKIQNHLR